MKQKTCCFTGHRILPKEQIPFIRARLEEEVLRLIHQGVLYYGCGGARGFDTLAAQTVLKLRREFPCIRLILVLPCPNQTKNWTAEEIRQYDEIRKQSDKVVMIHDTYTPDCMFQRNRHLVDYSGHCICYLTRKTGGTAYTVRYAWRKGLHIVNLASATAPAAAPP